MTSDTWVVAMNCQSIPVRIKNEQQQYCTLHYDLHTFLSEPQAYFAKYLCLSH